MSRAVKLSAGALLLTLSMGLAAIAAADEMAAPSGPKGEMMAMMKDAEGKLMQLAGAMPEAKYNWRPAKGVRSAGEVFMHVAGANLGIPALAGVTTPEGFNMETYEKSFTKKADIMKALKDSFSYMEDKFMSLSDEDMERTVDMMGTPTTMRGLYMVVMSHQHEHLGQAIAYARSNGVAPPWSAKQDEAFQKWMESKKKAGHQE